MSQFEDVFEIVDDVTVKEIEFIQEDYVENKDIFNISAICYYKKDLVSISSQPAVTSILGHSESGSIKKDDCYIVETYE